MNGAHVHLLLNHIPILGTLFAIILLFFGYFLRQQILSKAGLWTLVVAAIISIPSFLSGEEAEHAVEGIIGVSMVSVEEHEEQAEIAYWAILLSGAISLGTLLPTFKGQPLNRILLLVNMFFMIVTFLLMARTGNSGGSIRHPEIAGTGSVQSPLHEGDQGEQFGEHD